MRRWMWLAAMLPALAQAQDGKVARGAEVYRASCGVAYCHGPEGRAGRAPRLAGRGLEGAAIVRTVSEGIPKTSMPSFAAQLKPEDIEAVAAYIMSLGAGDGAAVAAKPAAAMPPAVERGRSLFFDATRMGNCGSCHEVGGWGSPVSIALQDLRSARLDNLRTAPTPEVITARPSGEDPFPAVVAEKTSNRVRVYDLSSRLPVLRSFASAEVTLTPGSSWRHETAASLYTDAELDSIAGYLRWAAGQP